MWRTILLGLSCTEQHTMTTNNFTRVCVSEASHARFRAATANFTSFRLEHMSPEIRIHPRQMHSIRLALLRRRSERHRRSLWLTGAALLGAGCPRTEKRTLATPLSVGKMI